MKSLRNKVLLSGIVLLFALIATIGSTYAWFTVSNTVSVSTFQVTANTEQALLGRVWNTDDTAGKYTSADQFFNTLNILDTDNVAGNDGYYYGGGTTGISTWRITPLTCVDDPATSDLTTYTALDFTGNISTDGLGLRRVVLSNTAATARTYTTPAIVNNSLGGYIVVKFWLMDPSNDGTQVTLSSLTVTSNDSNNLANSIYIGIADDTGGAGHEFVYPVDPDYGFTFLTGQPGFSSSDPSLNKIPTGDANSGQTKLLTLDHSAGDNTSIITLTTHMIPQLLTVYIWSEGWDAQATNGIMGSTMSINFDFTIL